MAKKGETPSLNDTGYRVYSQFEEDGVNSNSANLYFNFGWHGLFIDGNPKSIKRGIKLFNKHPHPWYYKSKFVCAKVTRENVHCYLPFTIPFGRCK